MRDVSFFNKIYLCTANIDFRNQTNGLLRIIQNQLGKQPLEARSIFIFTNRRQSSIRLLYWDATGFALWHKSLEKQKFKWPKSDKEASLTLSIMQLKWLLQGIDLAKIKPHEAVKIEEIF